MAKPEEVLEEAIIAYKNRTKLSDFADLQAVYDVNSVFQTEEGQDFHSYWCGQLRVDRFTTSHKQGIIYRPTVTSEIVREIEKCFKEPGRQGLMIKGPQGIGKSHSMVNVYRKLVTSSDNYLVTFIPYCKNWKTEYDFLNAVCRSLGIKDVGDLGLGIGVLTPLTTKLVLSINVAICKLLRKYGLKWVFMFDQINALFANTEAKKLPQLPEPFSLVDKVMEPNLVVSVIAASANNEVAYKESHDDFKEYLHRPDLLKEELELFVDLHRTDKAPAEEAAAADLQEKEPETEADTAMANNESDEATIDDEEETEEEEEPDECKKLMQITGGVPLYAYQYMRDPENFLGSIVAEVMHSIDQLKERRDWHYVLESLISSLLLLPTMSPKYDQKYFLKYAHPPDRYRYGPLFPAIAKAVRYIIWDDLMKYVETFEKTLLAVCKDEPTTNDTRGRIFEHIAIRRMSTKDTTVDLGDGVKFSVEAGTIRVFGNEFPSLQESGEVQKTRVPLHSNYPAIDWMWVCGPVVIGVQSHVSYHDDVFASFIARARAAKWFDTFESVVLLYFSPELATTTLVAAQVQPEFKTVALGRKTRRTGEIKSVQVQRKAISISSLSSTKDIQWPGGCSLTG